MLRSVAGQNEIRGGNAMNILVACEFCRKFINSQGIGGHQRGCLEKSKFIEKENQGAYLIELKKATFITGGGKIAIWLRSLKGNKEWLADIRKEGKENIENAKELLKFEKRHEIRFSYDIDKDKIIVASLQEQAKQEKVKEK